jgi:hypothetical protein
VRAITPNRHVHKHADEGRGGTEEGIAVIVLNPAFGALAACSQIDDMARLLVCAVCDVFWAKVESFVGISNLSAHVRISGKNKEGQSGGAEIAGGCSEIM